MIGTRKIAAVMAAAALASGCSSIVNHRGFVADEVLIASVQPGVDNRMSVERTLGRPTFTSEFGEPVWYYVASTTEQAPFTTPKITQHTVLAVRFDENDNVLSVDRTGMDQVARIDPDSTVTPTLGRDRGLLEDLFGNIGQVGAATGPGGAGSPTGQ
ncbi:outer membrane protein assembly factor BamE (lipoprotein component of BamABCDE complex) [Altererythrobacter atlanticus]|uniref:Outer membrane protein assembly factor BamE n=1 Tax=Croceibacterium atlanticum TaxID=1267766 RepID=A0A0F7KYT3_9SPHN|nr:outer membrane protein assembly factor BamE [Croceibacterium atlanticum]AKH43980.1 Outer membrane protein assembly factor BamE [Croceibacterium atlanticum]MBB5732285.1 outer membrane protein assembly factor BamE (lipoprotein component of BamABCDE complex) [Croceibacterium atlanticum]